MSTATRTRPAAAAAGGWLGTCAWCLQRVAGGLVYHYGECAARYAERQQAFLATLRTEREAAASEALRRSQPQRSLALDLEGAQG